MKNIPPFEGNTLNYLWPILLSVFIAIMNKRRMSVWEIAGLFMGFAGMTLLFYGRSEGGATLSNEIQAGHIAAFLAAVIWAAYSALTKKVPFKQTANMPVFLVIAIMCLFLHLSLEETVIPGHEIWFILFLGFGRIAYLFWDYAMKSESAALLATLSYFVPLFSTLFLIGFGYMPTNTFVFLSAVLIIAGCLTANAKAIKNKISAYKTKAGTPLSRA